MSSFFGKRRRKGGTHNLNNNGTTSSGEGLGSMMSIGNFGRDSIHISDADAAAGTGSATGIRSIYSGNRRHGRSYLSNTKKKQSSFWSSIRMMLKKKQNHHHQSYHWCHDDDSRHYYRHLYDHEQSKRRIIMKLRNGILILFLLGIFIQLFIGIENLSKVWNTFLQGPTMTSSHHEQQRQQQQPIQPDDPERRRPKKQRKIKRSEKQRQELYQMKERFQQLLHGSSTTTKLLPCRYDYWQTTNITFTTPTTTTTMTNDGIVPRPQQISPSTTRTTKKQATSSSQQQQLPTCIPFLHQQENDEIGGGFLQQFLSFGGTSSTRSLHQRKFVVRNTLPHDRILSCPLSSSSSSSSPLAGSITTTTTTKTKKDKHSKQQIITIPANGGIWELTGQQLQDCQNSRPRLFLQTPTTTTTTTSTSDNDNNNDSPPPPAKITNTKQLQPIIAVFNGADPSLNDYDDVYNNNNYDNDNNNVKRFPNCSIPCYAGGEYSLVSTIAIADTSWEIIQSMEGPAYYSQTQIHPQAYYLWETYYATTSFQSEIPVPYFSWAEYAISTTATTSSTTKQQQQQQHQRRSSAVNFDTAIHGASFLANNCNSQSHREQIVEELMSIPDGIRIDALSDCLHNAELPSGIRHGRTNKTAILEKYLFHLAFENQQYDDYITEKVWGALEAGTIPIYMGAYNIKDHVPTNSIIVVNDFDTIQELSDYLVQVSKNRKLYNSYHTWRDQPLSAQFVQKYQFTHVHSTCRICKWAFAKRYGWGWDHSQQEIIVPKIPHFRTCRNKLGLVGYPVKEYWLSTTSTSSSSSTTTPPTPAVVKSETSVKTCTLDDSNRVLLIGSHQQLHRTVYHQDGVTDLIITYHPFTNRNGYGMEDINDTKDRTSSSSSSWILKLETPIRTKEVRVVNGRQSLLQDEQSRITLLTSHEMSLPTHLDELGTIELPIVLPPSIDTGTVTDDSSTQQQQQQDPILLLHVRIIVEDLDKFHQGATNRVNYFGKLLTQDFFYPLETYEVLSS